MSNDRNPTIVLATLMIAALLTPAISPVEEWTELRDDPLIMDAALDPCLGYDACTGEDAGGYNNYNEVCPAGSGSCPAIDLTPFMDWDQVTSFYGQVEGFSLCGAVSPAQCDDDDVYLLDVEPGYQVNVSTAWNSTVTQHSLMLFDEGEWTGSTWSTPQIDFSSCGGGTGSCTVTMPANAAETLGIYIDCTGTGCQGNNPGDYRLDIEVTFPGDNGNIGDYTQEEVVFVETLLETALPYPWYPYTGGATSGTGTFDVLPGDTVAVVLSYCDSWCDTESGITVVGPTGSGINDDFFPLGYQSSDEGTVVSTYDVPGTYTLTVDDRALGDGGIGADAIRVADAGNVTGLFETDGFTLEDSAMGILTDTTDEEDLWAISIPEGYLVDAILSWDNSADLDLTLYSDYDRTTVIDEALTINNPELVQSTDADWDGIVWAEVSWYSGFGVSDAIYTLDINFIPVSGVPCYNQDDGGDPDTYYQVFTGDAGSDEVSDTKVIDTSMGSGTIRGMICGGYDDIDVYNLTVPPDTGIFATLVFDDEHDYDINMDLSKEIAASPGQTVSIDSEMDPQNGARSVTSNVSYDPSNALMWTVELYDSFGDGWNGNSIDIIVDGVVVLDDLTISSGSFLEATFPVSCGSIVNADMDWNGSWQYEVSYELYDQDGLLVGEADYNLNFGASDQGDLLNNMVVCGGGAPPPITYLLGLGGDLPEDDLEYNYTITWSTYTQSQEWTNPSDDAGMGMDAGDESSTWLSIPTVNSTYVSAAHDAFDAVDRYEIFIPQNYGMSVTLDYHSDMYMTLDIGNTAATSNIYQSDQSEYPQAGYSTFDQGGQTMVITVEMVRGSGEYSMVIEMLWPDNTVNPEDDCGIGEDFNHFPWGPQAPWNTNWLNHTGMATSTTTEIGPTGGTCVAWMHSAWDDDDGVRISIPANHFLNVTITPITELADTNTGFSIEEDFIAYSLFACPQFQYECGTDEWYGVSGFGSSENMGESGATVSTGSAPLDGGYVILRAYMDNFGAPISTENLQYEIVLEFINTSEIWFPTDDAGSASDACAAMACSLNVTDLIGATVSGVDAVYNATTGDLESLNWSGWVSAAEDKDDVYQFYVPTGFYYEICMTWDGQNYWGVNYNTMMRLYAYGDGSSSYPSTSGSWYTTPHARAPGEICIESYNQAGLGDVSGHTNYFQVNDFSGNVAWPSFVTMLENVTYFIDIEFFSLDRDGDGWINDDEIACGTDPDDPASIPSDQDADGVCDFLDQDSDGDGIDDIDDAFPYDPNESEDMDGDGVGDNSDEDTDGDGWLDEDEKACGTDAFDELSVPLDFDTDTICDVMDPDDDNDTWTDAIDAFPYDPAEWKDNDNDNIGDNADTDDDNDLFTDLTEIDCGSDPLSNGDIPTDLDNDGTCDLLDNDRDNDGVDNDVDVFPDDGTEWADFDGDGRGDNADMDDDNDLVADGLDVFPYDSSEWADNDADGVGDNADLNDDGDAWTDLEEIACDTDPLDASSIPADYDGDMVCDKLDADDDGDGVNDDDDDFPFDANEYVDSDGDGVGDFTDEDDDDDGWNDVVEPNCGSDPMNRLSVPSDNDADGDCDVTDADDDNDGVLDGDDAFPFNPSESRDTDGDGLGDNTDNDDDDDGWLDTTESVCRNMGGFGDPDSASVMPADLDGDGVCDALDQDRDGDGVPNPSDESLIVTCDIQPWEDAFPDDPSEQFDANCDGLGDTANPLSIRDDFDADPAPFIGAGAGALALIAGLGIAMRSRGGSGGDEDYLDETEDFDEEEDEDDEEGA